MIRLMLASLVWWSISLCLWFRFIFLTTRNINPEDSIRNILLYVLTGMESVRHTFENIFNQR